MRERIDPRRYNGAMFLGLDGIAVKSHGSTDAFGFANAIGVAIDMKVNGFLDKIRDELARLNAVPTPPPAPQDGCASDMIHSRSRSSVAAAICPSGSSPTTSWRAGSTRRTNGSCSAPASASATSPPRAS